MKVERWDGMVESDTTPGCVWWHLTVVDKGSKRGQLFDAPADTDEASLIAMGLVRYKERYPQSEIQ